MGHGSPWGRAKRKDGRTTQNHTQNANFVHQSMSRNRSDLSGVGKYNSPMGRDDEHSEI